MNATSTKTTAVSDETITPIAVDARGVVGRVFPGCFALRTWRSMDSSGKAPTGFKVGGRKLWRIADLERWAEWGFCDRAEFQTRLKDESNGRSR